MLQHRFLFEQMVRRELRQKYKGSALGIAWYLINPLVLMGAYALVFKVLLDVADIPDYPLFLLAGLIVWVFFSQALLAAAPSLVQNAPLVRKVRFPRETIPASVATVQLVTFLVMLVLLLPVALVVRGQPRSGAPAAAGRSWCSSSASCSACRCSWRCCTHTSATSSPCSRPALLPWFFLTPIFLPVDDFPGIGDHELIGDLLEWANPVAPFVDSVRDDPVRGGRARRGPPAVRRRRRACCACARRRRLPADGARPGGDAVSRLAAGEIVLEHATRSFKLVHERPRTLKELALVAAVGGPRVECTPCATSTCTSRRVRRSGWSAATAPARRRSLRCLAGIVPLDSGRAECGGRVVSLLELGAGFGPDFTGRENIWLNGALHGFAREEIEERIDRIVEFSELGEFIDVPVKAYSSGMFLRLGFSIVAHLDADVMLIDEILAVGDESFQRKCLNRISERMDAGATLVLVSHDPTAIERVCDRVVVLDAGGKAFDGDGRRGPAPLPPHARHRARRLARRCARRERPRARRSPSSSCKDAEGRTRHMFRPGEPLRAELTVSGRAERAVVALEVRDQRGELSSARMRPSGRWRRA